MLRFRFSRVLIFSLAFFPVVFNSIADSNIAEEGIPFFEVYTPDIYRSQSQNTAVAQSSNGFIYITNQNGLLEYDGTSWQVTKHRFGMQPLSIDIDSNDQIFLGYDHDIGRMKVDKKGSLYFESFIPLLEDSSIVIDNVWSTVVTPEGVFFEDWENIYRWKPGTNIDDPGELKVFSFSEDTPFSRHAYIRGHHYVTLYETGLCEIVGDSILPVQNGKGLGPYLPFEILPMSDGKLLFPSFIENEVVWLVFDGKNLTEFNGEIVNYSKNLNPIHCTFLKENLYALSTEIGGLLLFDEKGVIINEFNRDFGLPDEVAHTPILDHQHGLWIPLDYGICRIRLNSALSHYGYNQGLHGSINTLTRFQGTLFLATNAGLMKLVESEDFQKKNAVVQVEDLTNWCWNLLEVNGQLLVSTYQGIYRINSPDSPVELISEAWGEPLAATHGGKRIFFGSYFDGIGSLKYLGNGKWEDEGYIEGTQDEIYNILAENDSTLWLTVGGRALDKITVTTSLKEKPTLISTRAYSAEDGLPYTEMQYPFFYNNVLMTGNVLGLFYYDDIEDRFYPDTTINTCLPENFTDFTNPYVDSRNRIWFESNNESGLCAIPLANNNFNIAHFLSQGVTSTFSSYHFDSDGTVWAGGSGGLLVRYDESLVEPSSPKIRTVIQRILINGEQVSSHWNPLSGKQLVIPYSENSVRLEYSIPEFNFSSQNEYSYLLTGLYDKYLPWSHESYRNFDGLREGAYTFQVKGKNIYNQISPVTSFSFRILPPWYRTPAAYLGYIILLVSSVYVYIRTRTKRVERINRKLESLVVQRTSDLAKTVDDLHKEILERERAESERKKMEEQLYHAQKMETIGRITGGIAHDFNNMLAIIKGHSDLALLTLDPDTPIYKEFDLILKTAERAGNLSHQLLAYSRKQAMSPTSIDLNSIVRDINQMMDMSVFEKIKVEIVCAENLWKTRADRGHMEQSVFNLAINARDAMPEGGELKIETCNFTVDEKYHREHPYIPHGEFVRLSVSDTGVGIPEEIRNTIFEPFFTTKEQGKGTGLGLSSVYGTVKQSKGFLEVVSEVGLGTTFHVLLPRDLES